MLMPEALSITIPNQLSEIEKAARLIETFGETHGLPPEIVFNLNLALDEIVTNIISYAYDDDADHRVKVHVALDRDVVSVCVEDDGRAFNPLDAEPPDIRLGIDERPIGGLGVHIVRSLMDALEYRRENGRNIFIMSKRTPGDAGPAFPSSKRGVE
jgi:anti-sigma regulatory factor (Ser/Thr protein kinase)